MHLSSANNDRNTILSNIYVNLSISLENGGRNNALRIPYSVHLPSARRLSLTNNPLKQNGLLPRQIFVCFMFELISCVSGLGSL